MKPSRVIIVLESLLLLMPSSVSQKSGEPCNYDNSCSAGFSCHLNNDYGYGDFKCYHVPRLLNEPCVPNKQGCTDGLECLSSADSVYRCLVPRIFGEPCDDGNDPCGSCLLCDIGFTNVCFHDPRLEGEPCIGVGLYASPLCISQGSSDLTCYKASETCHRQDAFQCLDATKTVMDAIDTSYKTTHVTTKSIEMTDNKLLWDDFSTNTANNLAYQSACQDQGATYVELHYDAQCVTGINKTVSLFVSGQPRCYDTTCQEADDQALLAEYTLRPTEKRAIRDSNSTDQWVCSGQLRSDSWDFCLENTKLINQKDDMQIVESNLQAMVSTQKFLIFDKAEKLVTFPTVGQNFTDACQRSGGIIRVVKNADMVCGQAQFTVQAFTTCLWPLCGPNTDTDTQAVLAQQIEAKLKKDTQSNAKISGTCVFSSAVRLCVGSLSVAMILVGTFVFGVM